MIISTPGFDSEHDREGGGEGQVDYDQQESYKGCT